jgi:hypothetical protein
MIPPGLCRHAHCMRSCCAHESRRNWSGSFDVFSSRARRQHKPLGDQHRAQILCYMRQALASGCPKILCWRRDRLSRILKCSLISVYGAQTEAPLAILLCEANIMSYMGGISTATSLVAWNALEQRPFALQIMRPCQTDKECFPDRPVTSFQITDACRPLHADCSHQAHKRCTSLGHTSAYPVSTRGTWYTPKGLRARSRAVHAIHICPRMKKGLSSQVVVHLRIAQRGTHHHELRSGLASRQAWKEQQALQEELMRQAAMKSSFLGGHWP